jgi:SAM-dependent methyltransferase
MNSSGKDREDRTIDPQKAMERLSAVRLEAEDDFPRIVVVITPCQDLSLAQETIQRIPAGLIDIIEEITVFDVLSEEEVADSLEGLRVSHAWEKLRYHRNPSSYGYGDNLKNCFDYAIQRGFDYVIVLRGDGTYDPAYLPVFVVTALELDCPVVLGIRAGRKAAEQRESSSLLRFTANRILSRLEDMVLGIGLKDYHCGFRMFSTEVLEKIPYHLNAGDYLFDLHTLIQIRCLGTDIQTVSVPDFHDMSIGLAPILSYSVRAVAITIGYRLHQLHLVRSGIYFVDLGERYSLKLDRHSSHMQILDYLKPGSMVLDLGCGQSLLAEEYARRGVTAVGLDNIPLEEVSPHFDDYIHHDLEAPLNLPHGRVFDYVILSDVIEHLKNREVVMNSLRRYLKIDGQLIASTGNIAVWFYRLSLLLGRFEYGPRGILDRTHLHLYTYDSFLRFLRQSGYRILDVKCTPIPFELVFYSTGRSTSVSWITRLYYCLTLCWPRMFAYQFIAFCTFSSYESAEGEQMWEPGKVSPFQGE